MDRSIPSEGGKTLLKTRKQDVLFGVGINAEDNKLSTTATYRISNSTTVKSKNKGKDKSGHVVPLNTMGSITRTPSGSSNTNRNKLSGNSGPNKSGKSSGEYKRRSPEDNDKKSSKAAGRPSSFPRGIQSLSAHLELKDPKRSPSTIGADNSSTYSTHTRNNIDKRLTKAGGMTPKSTTSTEPDVPFVNGKTTTVHTEVNIYTYII
jgi:hypothetical protein